MKWSGKIGYSITVETAPGIWTDNIEEKKHVGNVIQYSIRNQSTGQQVNDNVVLNNAISIVATPYARENFQKMVYITFMGAKWKVTNTTIQYPRIVINIGEVYHE